MREVGRKATVAVTAAIAVGALALPTAATGAPPEVTRIITDPFTNASSQHATAVEPDSFAYGQTMVSAAQVGRFFSGGASGIGYATTTDGGATWDEGVLPNITS